MAGSSSAAAAAIELHDEAHDGLLGGSKGSGVRCGDVVRVLVTGCTMGVVAMVLAILGLVAPDINMKSPHAIAVAFFIVACQLPTVTAGVFACSRSPRAGTVHVVSVAVVALLVCCGLLTNIRVLDASEMSEYCEAHMHINCAYTTDVATIITLVLIGGVATVGALAAFYGLRLRKLYAASRPRPITAEAPSA